LTLTIQRGPRELQLLTGDITTIAVDAMVNAANAQLAGGGGVDGAIHRAGGPQLMRELSRFSGCQTGQAVVTTAGRLPAKYVFHAVGPVYRDGAHGEPQLLASCYRVCLELGAAHAIRVISFPSISTGVYGYPLEEAAALVVGEMETWLRNGSGSVEQVKLVQFSDSDHAVYRRHAQGLQTRLAAGG
jgi:O-acetyl-ADP-ribose deacetylase